MQVLYTARKQPHGPGARQGFVRRHSDLDAERLTLRFVSDPAIAGLGSQPVVRCGITEPVSKPSGTWVAPAHRLLAVTCGPWSA